jgi:hypothetical protein
MNAREFISPNSQRKARTPEQIAGGLSFGLDYPATQVGVNGKVTVAYDPLLGAQGLTLAQEFLNACAGPYNDMETFFGITGGAVEVVIVPLSGNNDGSGGAYHYGCDFASGGVLYLDATFANTTSTPLGLEIDLYIAELSECFMGPQNKGWGCGFSNGEGLSRFCAELYNPLPSIFVTGPTWAQAGFPDWVSQTRQYDRDDVATGCAIVYIYWMRSLGFTVTEIIQAGGTTLSANYQKLTGKTTAYQNLKAALQGLSVTSDNPFGAVTSTFFYNVQDKSGAVGHVTANGKIATDGQQGPGSFATWTHIVGVGSGRAFFYDEQNQSGAVGHVTADGKIAINGQQGPGTFGVWTHIAGFDDGRVFFYNAQLKSGAVGHFTADGKIATDGQQGPGTFGIWTHIVGIGRGRAFFYNAQNKSGAVGHITADGKIATDGQQGPGTFGIWTHIVRIGSGRVFFYDAQNRSGAVGHVTADGKIATDGQQGPGTFGAWTHIVGFDDGRAVFYDAQNKSGAVGHVTADGKIATDGQQGPGTFGAWTIISALR